MEDGYFRCQGDGAAAVQGHNGHGRVIQHGLDPPLGGVHCFGDSPGNLRLTLLPNGMGRVSPTVPPSMTVART